MSVFFLQVAGDFGSLAQTALATVRQLDVETLRSRSKYTLTDFQLGTKIYLHQATKQN